MQISANQRVFYLDLLRIAATFAVVFVHVSSHGFFKYPMFTANWYVSTVGDGLVRWCVPIFVMISGALFLRPEREVSYREILQKRIPRLLLAYVFWALLYVLYGFVQTDFADFTVKRLVRRCIVAPRIHLWFLPMLAGVYLLVPVLRRIAADKKLLRYVLLVWAGYILVVSVGLSDVFLRLQFSNIFAVNSVVGYAGYFLLGYYLSVQDFSKSQRRWIYLLGLCGLLVTVFGTLWISGRMEQPDETFLKELNLHVIATSAALFVAAKQLEPRCGEALRRFGRFVGSDLFGIYLVHELWLSIAQDYGLRFCCSEWVMLPALTVAIFILSLFTTKLIRLVPGLRRVVQ